MAISPKMALGMAVIGIILLLLAILMLVGGATG
jgi:hypothetical protein